VNIVVNNIIYIYLQTRFAKSFRVKGGENFSKKVLKKQFFDIFKKA
jgi:hypothetical protein